MNAARKLTILKKEGSRFLCSNNETHTASYLSQYFQVKRLTMLHRADRYGADSLLVTYRGNITKRVLEILAPAELGNWSKGQRIEKATPQWNRSDCRRNKINCLHYSDCQASRCGCEGSPTWQHRDDTDSCYAEPPPAEILKGYDTTVLAEWGFTR